MKITKSRLMEIIKEEAVKEVTSDKQRRFMCAMKDKTADDRPEGLSKDEAEEMCTGPMKEEEALPANVNVAKPEIDGSEDKALETLIKQLVQYAAENDLDKGKTASLMQQLSDHLTQGGGDESGGGGGTKLDRESLQKMAAEGGEKGELAQDLLDSEQEHLGRVRAHIKSFGSKIDDKITQGADDLSGAVQMALGGDGKIYYKFLENKKITKARLMEIIKEEIEEGLFGLGKPKDQGPKYAKYPDIKRSSVPMDVAQAGNVENLLQKVAEIINMEENNPESSPETKQLALKQAQHLMAQAVFHRVLEEEEE
jgi:hypothetical protein